MHLLGTVHRQGDLATLSARCWALHHQVLCGDSLLWHLNVGKLQGGHMAWLGLHTCLDQQPLLGALHLLDHLGGNTGLACRGTGAGF